MQSAIAYATKLGLAVFPVGPDCRKPLTAHGYKDAARTVSDVRTLWAGRGRTNLACATGAVSGVLVLDVDVKGANGIRTLKELEKSKGPLPRTWQTCTPSGGLHIWFRHLERRLRNRVGFAPGLDIRTDGGSVALPPSRKPAGQYVWEICPYTCPLATAPDWLLDLADPPPRTRPSPPVLRVRSLRRLANYVTAAVEKECAHVASMKPNTGRNHALFVAAAKLGELVGTGVVAEDAIEQALEAAAHDCGLACEDGLRAVRATIRSGLERGVLQPREVVR
jgi:hypothetical protein